MLLPKKINNKIQKIYMKKLEQTCHIGMTKAEMEAQARKINISEDMQLAMDAEIEKLKTNVVSKIETILKNEHKITGRFIANQYEKWGECFNLFELYYILTLKFTVRYCKRVNKIKDGTEKLHSYKFGAIRELQGRACQIYAEILCLIENGFADGAYARWRTLYEIMIIVGFIKSHGEEAAKAFIDGSFVDTQHCNWAKDLDCFKHMKNVSFSAIEKECDFDEGWKREYKKACKAVHASPEGTFGRLAHIRDGDGVTLVGRCDYGIDIPATHSCISLSIINAEFLTIFPDFNTLVESNVLIHFQEDIISSFEIAEKEIFGHKNKPKIGKITPSLK